MVHEKCGGQFVVKPNQFHWRGRNFSGLVCESCNALYDNPEDSFMDHVMGPQPPPHPKGESTP